MEPSATSTCPVCHQPTLSTYYFCPNCGAKLNAPPLSTTLAAQVWIYLFSIVLPFICFIMIHKWQGIAYLKSSDPKTKQIGMIALTLIIISTVVTIWLAYIWTQQMIQSSVNSINADMSGY